MAGIRVLVVQAHEEAIKEYKANFKDTDDYLNLMKDAMVEYKESSKWVDPNFDTDHHDRLILGDPQTPASEDSVGFNQIDPIGTPGTVVGPPTDQDIAPTEKPVEPPADQDAAPTEKPTEPTAN